jgi:hypothetical protein
MEKMYYGFFTEQPVRGRSEDPNSRCIKPTKSDRLGPRDHYFLQVLHSFDNNADVRIQRPQISALRTDSLLVIDTKVLLNNRPRLVGTPRIEYTAALSISVKVMFNAQERRERPLRLLLDQAGLQIKDIR